MCVTSFERLVDNDLAQIPVFNTNCFCCLWKKTCRGHTRQSVHLQTVEFPIVFIDDKVGAGIHIHAECSKRFFSGFLHFFLCLYI